MSKILSPQNKELWVAMILLAGSIVLIGANLFVAIPAMNKVSAPLSETSGADPIDTNSVNEALTVLEGVPN
jgi:hypothetical protein